MAITNPQNLRLSFKRSFVNYYLTLLSPGIADPSEAFTEGYKYLSALHEQLGQKEFMFRLDEETVQLAGQIEQDLRHKVQRNSILDFSSTLDDSDTIEDRLRECFEAALERINLSHDSKYFEC